MQRNRAYSNNRESTSIYFSLLSSYFWKRDCDMIYNVKWTSIVASLPNLLLRNTNRLESEYYLTAASETQVSLRQ